VESDIRFYRRRASEELAAAGRAVTESARERRMMMAGIFLDKLKALDPGGVSFDSLAAADRPPVFKWASGQSLENA
jgi:hypothetical protein